MFEVGTFPDIKLSKWNLDHFVRYSLVCMCNAAIYIYG